YHFGFAGINPAPASQLEDPAVRSDRLRSRDYFLHALRDILRCAGFALETQPAEKPGPARIRSQNRSSRESINRPMHYCHSPFFFEQRKTRKVVIGDPAAGGIVVGDGHPIVMQSMLTSDTMDTEACVQQTLDLVAVGCQLVRITAPTVKDAANLKQIVAELRARGCLVPIVADVHFKPEAA